MAENFQNDLDQLMQLQQLDTKVFEMRQLCEKLPLELETFKEELEAATQKLTAFEESFSAKEAEMRQLEREVKAEEEKIAKSQEKLMAVKTNEEYHAALREIDNVKKANQQREDQILEKMEFLEGVKEEKTGYEKAVEEKTALLQQKSSELEGKVSEAKSQEGQLTKQRQEYLSRIQNKQLLATYEGLIANLPQAVVQIYKEFCEACKISLQPRIYYAVQAMSTYSQCPNCHRILYWHPNETKEDKIAEAKNDNTNGKN